MKTLSQGVISQLLDSFLDSPWSSSGRLNPSGFEKSPACSFWPKPTKMGLPLRSFPGIEASVLGPKSAGSANGMSMFILLDQICLEWHSTVTSCCRISGQPNNYSLWGDELPGFLPYSLCLLIDVWQNTWQSRFMKQSLGTNRAVPSWRWITWCSSPVVSSLIYQHRAIAVFIPQQESEGLPPPMIVGNNHCNWHCLINFHCSAGSTRKCLR